MLVDASGLLDGARAGVYRITYLFEAIPRMIQMRRRKHPPLTTTD